MVVLRLEHYGGLGIVRSLGRLGIPVYGIDKSRSAPGLMSRYCRGKFIWDVDAASAEASVEFLLDVGRKIHGRPFLIPTTDESMILVADNAEVLKEWFVVPDVPAETIRALCNKKDMYSLARRFDVPTAEAFFPRSKDDLASYLEYVNFPVVLKGIDGGRLERRTGKKMVIVHSKQELLENYARLEDPQHPNLMLQEYLANGENADWMFNGYFNQNSECLFGFTGKKIRQNPVYTGMTSLGVCLQNKVVAEITQRFAKAICYKGILDVDFRFDPRDKTYKILDFNPRIGATFRLFSGKNGLDVARALYLDLTGQPVPPDEMLEGRKWVVEDKDIRSSYDYFKDRRITFRSWVTSFREVQEAGYFSSDDLVPFVMVWLKHIARGFIKLFRKGKKSTPSNELDRQVVFNRHATEIADVNRASQQDVLVETINDPKQFHSMAEDWNKLASRFNTPLLRHEWFAACFEAFCPPHKLHIIVVRSRGEIAAIAPLVSVRRFGAERLEFLGASTLGEPSGFLYKDDRSLNILIAELVENFKPMVLHKLRANSPESDTVQTLCAKKYGYVLSHPARSPWIQMNLSWNDYEKTISASRRSSLRRARNRAKPFGDVQFQIVLPKADEVEPMMQELIRVEAASWKGEKGTSMLQREGLRKFISLYASTAVQLGTLRMCFLRINEKVIAAMIALEEERRFWILKIGYDQEYAQCSPGILLMHESIRYAFERGLGTFDFLGSDEAWIHMWTEDMRPYVTHRVYPISLSGGVWFAIDVALFLKDKRRRKISRK